MWYKDELKAPVRRKEAAWKEQKKSNEQFGKKMNGNRKLVWKEVSNAKGGKVESFNTIKEVGR